MLNPMEPTTAAVLAAMHFVRDDPTLRAESVKTAGWSASTAAPTLIHRYSPSPQSPGKLIAL